MAITLTEVSLAAEEILQSGEQPTIEKIRLHLGGTGSNSTISKYLRDWRQQKKMQAPHSIPSESHSVVHAVVESTWQQLREQANAEIESIKSTCQAQIELAKQQLQEAIHQTQSLQQSHQELQTAYHALSAEKEILMLDYKAIQSAHQLLIERHEGLENRHQEMKTLYEQQILRLEEKHQAEIHRLQTQADHQILLAQNLADSLKSHFEEARVQSLLEIDQLKVDKQKLLGIIDELKSHQAALQQSIDEKSWQHQQLLLQYDELQETLHAQQALWDNLHDKRWVTDSMVAEFESLPIHVSNQMQRLLTEKINELLTNQFKSLESSHVELDLAKLD